MHTEGPRVIGAPLKSGRKVSPQMSGSPFGLKIDMMSICLDPTLVRGLKGGERTEIRF